MPKNQIALRYLDNLDQRIQKAANVRAEVIASAHGLPVLSDSSNQFKFIEIVQQIAFRSLILWFHASKSNLNGCHVKFQEAEEQVTTEQVVPAKHAGPSLAEVRFFSKRQVRVIIFWIFFRKTTNSSSFDRFLFFWK